MKFRILEGVTIADIAFEAYGKTIEKLFANAALALSEVMVDTKTIERIKSASWRIRIKNEKLEDLLFNFLSEIVFLKDSKNLLFSKYQVKIKQKSATYFLEAVLYGEEIDRNKHHLKVDVKGVTKHRFSLRRADGRYICRVVVDV